MAAIFAIRAGLRDAREGRAPYFFWAVFINRSRRPELFRLAWRDVGKVFLAAFALDVIYELEGLSLGLSGTVPHSVALVLAIVPYLMIRGPVTRIARAIRARGQETDEQIKSAGDCSATRCPDPARV